jgi:hypothetical protein
MLDARQILDKTRRLQTRWNPTEKRWFDVWAARQGEITSIAPDLVSEEFPKPIVANFIDTVARDLAEMVAPLPAFNCSSASMQSDAARKFADRRSKIAQHYVAQSGLDTQMLWAADQYFTFGVAVAYIEPDMELKCPRITFEDPIGGYPEFDRWNRITSYTKRFYGESDVIAGMFPEYDTAIRKAATNIGAGSDRVELIRYCDPHQITLVFVGKEPVVLMSTRNILGETPIALARRPWLSTSEIRGQFDDVVWVALARDMLAKLQLEATEKAVQAPLALPNDVQEIGFGADAILRTATPEKIRRVGLEMSPAGFTQSEQLLREMHDGTRYPQARTGGDVGSIVTGRGVQALLGGFDTQIKAAQQAFRSCFVDSMRLCFKMDEKLWGNSQKQIRGHAAGVPYDLKYTPAKDIAGDHTVEVTYGFAAGMDPNRAVVMLLQLRAEKAISRDYFMRQMPFDLNVLEEQSKVDVEETREAMKQSIYGYAQAIPALAQQGMDPGEIVRQLVAVVRGLQKGRAIEEVVSEAFAPQPPAAPPAPGDGGPEGPGGPGGPSGGLTDSGLMRGVSPGQAGMAPGGRPDLSVMLAGLTGSGQPQMSAFTARRRRI